MADGMSLYPLKAMKVSLIVMHTLVVLGLTLVLFASFSNATHGAPFVTIVVLLDANSLLTILAAYHELRPLLLITGSLTLILLLMALFTVSDQLMSISQFLYILSCVAMSYALADLVRINQQLSRIEVYDMESTTYRIDAMDRAVHIFEQVLPSVQPSSGPPADDRPPPYEECPPPKYEEAIAQQN